MSVWCIAIAIVAPEFKVILDLFRNSLCESVDREGMECLCIRFQWFRAILRGVYIPRTSLMERPRLCFKEDERLQ